MTYSEKLLDPRWQKLRLKVFERDKFSCLCCNSQSETLHVHHLVYRKSDPWDSPVEDLETLCWKCHEWREQSNNVPLGAAFAGFWERVLKFAESEKAKMQRLEQA